LHPSKRRNDGARSLRIGADHLGAGNLRPAQQEQLLAALQPASSPAAPSPVSRAALAEVVHQLGAWRGSGRGVGSVIVVCKRHSPATALWTKPPRLGLALIATPAELNQLVQHKPALLRALPKPLRIDVERPVDEGVLLSMTLAELDSVANERPWYRRVGQILAALLGLAPASNDLQRPAGPDALLAAHLGGSNR